MEHGIVWQGIEPSALDEIGKQIAHELNHSPSDRAVAILAAGLIEQRMAEQLRSVLRNDSAALGELFNDGRPLSHLKTLSHLTYVMGWFGEHAYHDLKHISKIRDMFAHKPYLKGATPESVSFEASDIKSKCMASRIPTIIRRPREGKPPDSRNPKDWYPPPEQPRDMFIRSATLIHGYLGIEFFGPRAVFTHTDQRLP